METEFTPVMSLLGGVLIGTASVLLMATMGRIMGATGILAGILPPISRADFSWRLAIVAGMVSGPAAVYAFSGQMPEISIPIPLTLVLIGGFIVGIGVTFGSGCTSGHGVCGIARLSGRSIAATLTFMATTAITVFIVRHVLGA